MMISTHEYYSLLKKAFVGRREKIGDATRESLQKSLILDPGAPRLASLLGVW